MNIIPSLDYKNWLSVKEISGKLIDVSESTIRRELKEAIGSGLVVSKRIKNRVFYRGAGRGLF